MQYTNNNDNDDNGNNNDNDDGMLFGRMESAYKLLYHI